MQGSGLAKTQGGASANTEQKWEELMSDNQNILKEVKPRLHALIDELVAKGAERSAVIYMIEKESTQLRNTMDEIPDHQIDEPSNDWPSATK